MKKIIYGFLFLFSVFILNIGMYFFSKDYQFFVKKIKYGEDYVDVSAKQENTNLFSDEELPTVSSDSGTTTSTGVIDCSKVTCINFASYPKQTAEQSDNSTSGTLIESNNQNSSSGNTTSSSSGQVVSSGVSSLSGTSLTGSNLDLVNGFSGFNLTFKKYDDTYSLFLLTDEYPNKYLTYSSDKFDLYIFENDSFDGMLDFFQVLAKQQNFEVNKTNSFGNRSFYINTSDVKYIKLVIKSGNNLFGLNIKKQYFNEIKQILKKF